MKQQITENKENLFFGIKIAWMSVVTLKKETTKDYPGVAWRHFNQRFWRCDLKQMLTDDGHPRITTVHFESLKRVVSEVVFSL